MMGLHFTGRAPFKRVFFHLMVRDEQGRPMHRTWGNVIDPMEMKDEYGMDALRFTLAAACAKGREMRLSRKEIAGNRKFLNKIWNAARFALMNLEGFQPAELDREGLELEDRWILSRLARQIRELRRNLDNYEFNLAATGLYAFVWHDFCDWYLEMVKPRLYGEDGRRKQIAQTVLYRTLVDVLKMLHPFIPYITEEIWQLLPDREAESVMIAPFPHLERGWIEPEVEGKMESLQQLISAIRTIRSEMNIPPQRKARVLIRAEDQGIKELVEANGVFFHELAGVQEFEVGRDVERLEHAPRVILEGAEVFLPLEGLVDMAQERARLERELEEVRRALESSLRKLKDEQFLQRAPQEIVDKEKVKAKELRERTERLRKNLQILGVEE